MSPGNGAMPPAVAEVFDPLRNELVGLHERWALYWQVFGVEEDRIDLLNRITPIFFGHTQWAMYLDVILALCRYTDGPGDVTKKGDDRRNCTLARLVNVVTADDATFGGALEANEWAAVKKCRDDDFEEIRSKRIAHNDFMKVTARFSGQPVGWPSREQVKRFLALCTDLMAAVQQHYIGCPFVFDFNAHDAQRSAGVLFKVLTEYAEFHDAQVMSGKRAWLIRPPKGWPNLGNSQ
jgi:hypothetical protein